MKPPPKKRKTASNRETLKNFFRQGSLPTEEHFGDLIDSTLAAARDRGWAGMVSLSRRHTTGR